MYRRKQGSRRLGVGGHQQRSGGSGHLRHRGIRRGAANWASSAWASCLQARVGAIYIMRVGVRTVLDHTHGAQHGGPHHGGPGLGVRGTGWTAMASNLHACMSQLYHTTIPITVRMSKENYGRLFQ
jgi:hypothetical protein